jgi:alpha-beta hydrolase superfamily lysophospholipase
VNLDFTDSGDAAVEVGAAAQHKHRVVESWVVRGSAGDDVLVDAYLPLDEPKRIVVMAHGADNSRKARYIEVAGKSFTRRGTAVVAMDAPLHGDRVGARPMTDPVGIQADLLVQSVRDHRRLLDAVVARWPDVPVGFAGFSMGGLFGVPLVAMDDRIRSAAIVIAGSTRVSYPQRFRRLDKHARERLAVTDPAIHAPRVGDRPVLLLNADADELVSREAAIALYDAFIGPKELVFMPGTHTEWGYAARWFRRLEQFFLESLVMSR